MALKPLRPCRHPGCAALTREGYCPKHKPQKAPRRVSAEYHSWYSLPIWTDDLRPAQLLREPFCRECAKRGDRIWATVVDHIKPHRGSCSSTRPTTRACASAVMTARRPWSSGKRGAFFEHCTGDMAGRLGAGARLGMRLSGRREAFGLRPSPRVKKVCVKVCKTAGIPLREKISP